MEETNFANLRDAGTWHIGNYFPRRCSARAHLAASHDQVGGRF